MPDLSPDVERELEAIDDALAGRRVASDLTELGELALLLREDRPEPNDGFGRDLDRRMRLGFPKGDPSVRASGRRWGGGGGSRSPHSHPAACRPPPTRAHPAATGARSAGSSARPRSPSPRA